MSVLVRFEQVAMGYRRAGALFPPFDLELGTGSFVGIVGPNGSGKTTLLRTLAGVTAPLSGRVVWPRGRCRIGYVPQQRSLDPLFPFTAAEVVALGMVPDLPRFGRLRADHAHRSMRALERVGLSRLGPALFRELSGGQRQRVLLARALVIEPQVVILDEPTSALDAVAAEQMLAEFRALHQRGVGVVLVSHDLGRTAAMADQLVILDRERGVLRAGPVDEVMTAQVLTEIYGVPVDVHEHECHYMVDFHVRGAGHDSSAPRVEHDLSH